MTEDLEEVLKKIEYEPNREEFEYQGYHCLIRRSMHAGQLCGYVAVPKGHKYYGKDTDSDELCRIEVHGGITWANHFPELQDGLWYIGFDCAHYMDLMPFMSLRDPALWARTGATYKDFEYVKSQIKNMVHQFNKGNP